MEVTEKQIKNFNVLYFNVDYKVCQRERKIQHWSTEDTLSTTNKQGRDRRMMEDYLSTVGNPSHVSKLTLQA